MNAKSRPAGIFGTPDLEIVSISVVHHITDETRRIRLESAWSREFRDGEVAMLHAPYLRRTLINGES